MREKTRSAIRSAAERLLAGKPIRSISYDLTATNLAKEASVGRATLNRAPDLRNEFVKRVQELRLQKEASHPALLVEQLRAEVVDTKALYRKDTKDLEDEVKLLANQVQALTLMLELQHKDK